MRAFFVAYRETRQILAQPARELTVPELSQGATESVEPILPQAVAEIPWFHNVILLEKTKDPAERLWYAAKTLEHGWSRAVLTVQIEGDVFRRQGKAITNFALSLPAPQSDLAQQALKDPYLFDFLTLHDGAVERDLEAGLLDHIQKFLIELGTGFAFVGRQVPISVSDDDDYLDLLFYHLKRVQLLLIHAALSNVNG
jgi:predicted nuclease of restriction endonuclease-like (RecB) superfamily